MTDSPFIWKGAIEIFTGPMAGGKSQALFRRYYEIDHVPGSKILMVKPSNDTRTTGAYTRAGKVEIPAIGVNPEKPSDILALVKPSPGNPRPDAIAIEDAQFFEEGITKPDDLVSVVLELSMMDIDVLISALDLDFRGEPYLNIRDLMSFATHDIFKGRPVCRYEGCGQPAIRTQRLINNQPALYSSPRKLAGDETGSEAGDSIKYVPRCIKHHFVPKD